MSPVDVDFEIEATSTPLMLSLLCVHEIVPPAWFVTWMRPYESPAVETH